MMNKKVAIIKYKNYSELKSKNALISLCFGMMFFLLALLRTFKSVGIISFFTFLCYFIFYIFAHKRILIKYMYIFFAILFYFIGNSICDLFRVYLVELGTYTRYVGSLPLFTLAFWFYLVALSILDSKISPFCYHNHSNILYKISDSITLNGVLKKYARPMVFMMSLVLFAAVIRAPAFLYNVNRFEYSQTHLNGFISNIRTIPMLMAPIVIVSTIEDNRLQTFHKKISGILISYAPYLLFGLWIGNKFGLFWQLFYSLVIPCTVYLNLDKLKNGKLFRYLVLGITALVAIVLVFYIVRGNDSSAIAEKLFRRFAAQGEIWWKVIEDGRQKIHGFSSFLGEIEDIVLSFESGGEIKKYGVYKFMTTYGSMSYIKSYLDMDMRFSAMGFELSYCFWGIFSFIIFPLMTLPIYIIITNNYINCVECEDFLGAFALLRILIVFNNGVCQGDWYRFGSTLDLLIIGLLLFSILVRKYSNKRYVKRH